MKTWFENLRAVGEKIYRDLNARTDGALRILKRTFERFSEDRSSQAAAGLAFYIFFSLFPLLLVLVAVASSLLREEAAFAEALNFIAQAIPVSRELIARNLRTAMERRTAVGSISFVGALWSATNAFATLTQHINRAWKQAQAPGFLRKRILGFAIVGVLVIVLLFSIIASTALPLVPRWIESTLGVENVAFFRGWLWSIVTRLIPPVLLLLLLIGLYRWVPNTDVRWRAALWGARSAAGVRSK